MKIYYHTTEGFRKGLHPVSIEITKRGKTELHDIFLVDEPGAWFDDEWNCHVDGCDYPVASKEEAIEKGLKVLGYHDCEIVDGGAYHGGAYPRK